jgi:hypothetical protein
MFVKNDSILDFFASATSQLGTSFVRADAEHHLLLEILIGKYGGQSSSKTMTQKVFPKSSNTYVRTGIARLLLQSFFFAHAFAAALCRCRDFCGTGALACASCLCQRLFC